MYKSGRSASRGFTLVELVLVMIIGGVLAAIAVPRMVDRSAYQTRGGASEVRTALRYAQRLAMAKNREVCVTTTLLPDLRLTFSSAAAPATGAACDQLVIRPGDLVGYVVTPPAGITLTSTVPTFRFDGRGRPITTPPNLALTVPVSFTVGAAGGSGTISIQPETGYVQ